MAALQNINLSATVSAVPPAAVSAIKAAIAAELWNWYDAHRDDKIKTVKIWIISHTIRVRDLRMLFEMLLGPQPVASFSSPAKL